MNQEKKLQLQENLLNQQQFQLLRQNIVQRKEQHNQTQRNKTKKIFVGNLNTRPVVNNIMELFVLTSSWYLRESCNIEMPITEKTGKSRGFTFISCPECVSDKLIKFSEIDFFDTSINVEKKLHQQEKELTKVLQIQKIEDHK